MDWRPVSGVFLSCTHESQRCSGPSWIIVMKMGFKTSRYFPPRSVNLILSKLRTSTLVTLCSICSHAKQRSASFILVFIWLNIDLSHWNCGTRIIRLFRTLLFINEFISWKYNKEQYSTKILTIFPLCSEQGSITWQYTPKLYCISAIYRTSVTHRNKLVSLFFWFYLMSSCILSF